MSPKKKKMMRKRLQVHKEAQLTMTMKMESTKTSSNPASPRRPKNPKNPNKLPRRRKNDLHAISFLVYSPFLLIFKLIPAIYSNSNKIINVDPIAIGPACRSQREGGLPLPSAQRERKGHGGRPLPRALRRQDHLH